mgnify:FL=1|jgi:hypothetical protein|tara:strand:+ start:139 stop:609 length:471 start_codon:yes stop_codon:yes gene_type:complete
MGTSTFSGPIRAGNIRNTTGTTVGSDVANVGYVVMTQQYVADLSGGALAAVNTDIVIPADSKIVNILVDLEVAANATTNISVGQAGGGAATFLNALATGTTVGLKTVTTQGGGTLAWKDIGSSDLRLNVTASASTTAGSAVITVMYAQAFDTAIQP